MARKLTLGATVSVAALSWLLLVVFRSDGERVDSVLVSPEQAESQGQRATESNQSSELDPFLEVSRMPSEWTHIASDTKPLIAGYRQTYIAENETTGRYWRVDEVYRDTEKVGKEILVERTVTLANQYIVKIANESYLDRLEAAVLELGYKSTSLDSTGLLRTVVAGTEDDLLVFRERIESLSTTSEWVEYGEPDYLVQAYDTVPSDQRFIDQVYLNQPHQNVLNSDIDAPQAWDKRRDASNIVIGVIDSGARVTHEDLAGNLWSNPGEIANGVDDDGNGFIDDIHGINAIDDNGDLTDEDDSGHGTHVAGIVAAVGDNGVGISGVAWDAQIMPLKFLDETGLGVISDAIQCVAYAIDQRVDIINNSWGGSQRSKALEDLLRSASNRGILIATAAGNESQDLSEEPVYPAAYEIPLQVVVVATDSRDGFFSFSNYDSRKAHIAAPGETLSLSSLSDSSYDTLRGTSMAAPQVAGALALLKADNPGQDPSWYINRLLESAESRTSLLGKCLSSARLNLNRMLHGLSNHPGNDAYGNATAISDDGDIVSGTLSFATLEEGEESPMPGSSGQTVWYRWVASRSGTAIVELNPIGHSGVVAIYRGGSLETLERKGFGVSSQKGEDARLSVSVAPGEEYFIQIDRLSGSGSVFSLQIRLAPENDSFEDAEILMGESFSVASSNWAASRESGEPFAYPSSAGNSVWYQWEAPRDGQFYLNVTGIGSQMFTRAYTGSELGSLFDPSTDLNFSDLGDVVLNVTEGTAYSIVVDSQSTEGGSFRLQGHYFEDPVIIREPSDQFVRQGDEAVFRVAVFGVGTPSYQWYREGEPVEGAESNSLRIRDANSEDVGTYQARIEIGGSILWTREARLELASSAVRILKHPTSRTLKSGAGAILSAFIVPSDSLSYQWYKDGEPIEGATSSTHTIDDASNADAGFYRLDFLDDSQTRSTVEAFVHVSEDDLWEGVVNPIQKQRPPFNSERQTVNGFVIAKLPDAIGFSRDGDFWQYGAIKDANGRTDVAYGNGAYVAVFDWGLYVSKDLIQWEATENGPGSINGVCFGHGRFVIASTDGVHVSEDGRTWTQISIPGTTWAYGIGFGNGEFLLQTGGSSFSRLVREPTNRRMV